MDTTDPDRHPLDMLADDFVVQLRQGTCLSVADYVERSPELAEELRELLPAIAMVERLSHREHVTHLQARLEAQVASRRSHRLGDYRIVREIGRGGMGIVYEAILESLVAQFPGVSNYGVALGRAAHSLAACQREAGQPRASRQTLDDALLHLLVLVQPDKDPQVLRRSITQLQAGRRRLASAL